MISLAEKIMLIYPEILPIHFGSDKFISVCNDSDGRGDYIAKWEHPTLPRPTEEQLA